MIVLRREMMIISNGLHKYSSKLSFIIVISLMSFSNAEEVKVAPLINLDKIEPSYDEEFNIDNLDNQLPESKQNNNNINNDSSLMAEISILNKITTKVDLSLIHI